MDTLSPNGTTALRPEMDACREWMDCPSDLPTISPFESKANTIELSISSIDSTPLGEIDTIPTDSVGMVRELGSPL